MKLTGMTIKRLRKAIKGADFFYTLSFIIDYKSCEMAELMGVGFVISIFYYLELS